MNARITLGALIVIDVHARDVIKHLCEIKIDSIGDFEWLAQLRYYFDDKKPACFVRMITTELEYAYEYLGNSGRSNWRSERSLVHFNFAGLMCFLIAAMRRVP